MAHDIIMPALGMAQDTGIIVAWRKALGDPVKAGDILMEVETDKSTVEVEAGHDGYLASVMAGTGVPIPVGQVVAIISEDRNDIAAAPAESAPPPPAVKQDNAPAATPTPAPTPTPTTPTAPAKEPASPTGRVLASPKARREAEARGIDLGRLVSLGIPEPIHVADIIKAKASSPHASTSLMRVRISRTPFEAFLKWTDEAAGAKVSGLSVWAAFAAGSFRTATGMTRDDEIVVQASRFPESLEAAALRNPDLAGLAGIKTESPGGAATLTVLDLTETPLTEYRPAGGRPLPHLTIANGQETSNFDLYLEFDPALLPAETAFAFLKDLADRAHVPLRHLL